LNFINALLDLTSNWYILPIPTAISRAQALSDFLRAPGQLLNYTPSLWVGALLFSLYLPLELADWDRNLAVGAPA
jgi:hypothetical protein